MKRFLFVLAFVLLPHVLFAQEVNRWADDVSWGTAFINPAISAVQAARSDTPKCQLAQLGVTAGILTAAVVATKHFVTSPRPCAGCAPDGWPSGHTAFSGLGAHGWRYGFEFTTASLRMLAHRHTAPQVTAGALYAAGATLAGEKLISCPQNPH